MILIIDDDIAVRSSLSLLMESAEYQVITADRQGAALHALHTNPIQAVIMDMNYSAATTGQEGLELLQEVKERWPEIPVLLLTGWGSIELAVQGMRLGATDFITKPWDNQQLLASLKVALQIRQPPETSITRKQLDQKYDFSSIIGHSAELVKLLQTVGRIAASDAPVLIYGESGTGKELIAEALHQNSNRKNQNLVKVNLGAITPTLFESEMFGHKKGAFTDAHADRTGRFQMADGGTIFLDEIGELDMSSQVKLLRVLQEKRFEPVGSSQTIKSDFRIVCASNKRLDEMVNEKTFREDLFYRINLITLKLPALKNRNEDIPLLADHFLQQFTAQNKMAPLKVGPEAVKWLKKQKWPGNIRELKNKIERAALLASGDVLQMDDFTETVASPYPKLSAKPVLPKPGQMTLEEMEKSMIEKALDEHPENLSQVARTLGIRRGQLYRRLEKYQLGPYKKSSK